MIKINNLQNFYTLMFKTKDVRIEITEKYLKDEKISAQLTNPLRQALDALTSLDQQNDGTYKTLLTQEKSIKLDLSYEINELKKDLFFLTHSEDEFYSYLEGQHTNFLNQVNEGEAKLQEISFKNFITDRDGTINNYCGRYASSIQSIYNAVFLTRFAKNATENSLILTSAPLENIGLANISVAPPHTFIYAGSKGREYSDKNLQKKTFPIKKEKQDKLNILNKQLKKLLKDPSYEKFSFIGSGLQLKFGQTTIARQDISKSIAINESISFLHLIKKMVHDIDPHKEFFKIEDTGLDIEIILTVEAENTGEELKDFDKGDGVQFLDEDIPLNLHEGPCLICGDTNSDIPMLTTSMKIAKETYSVFVTDNDALKEKVYSLCPTSFVVSTPDILVAILNNLGRRKG